MAVIALIRRKKPDPVMGLADRTAWRRASRRTPEPSFAEFFPI